MFKHDEAVRDLTMARVSTKENKNIYQLTREELKLSREAAGELLESIQPDRIEKIENERSLPHPEEILVMADKYKQPGLCNYYCANQCPIGQQYVPEVKIKALSQIVLEMLASLNAMNKQKERLIEITADGQISGDEIEDFIFIQEELERISITVETLQLWSEQMLATGIIDAERYQASRQKVREGRA
nr:XRE family transcriptional regulator [uncultured Dysosmobacter sp.]